MRSLATPPATGPNEVHTVRKKHILVKLVRNELLIELINNIISRQTFHLANICDIWKKNDENTQFDKIVSATHFYYRMSIKSTERSS